MILQCLLPLHVVLILAFPFANLQSVNAFRNDGERLIQALQEVEEDDSNNITAAETALSATILEESEKATLTNDTAIELSDMDGVRSQGQPAAAGCGNWVMALKDCRAIVMQACKKKCCGFLDAADDVDVKETFCAKQHFKDTCSGCATSNTERPKSEPTEKEWKVGSLLSYRKSTEDAAVSVTLLNVHYDNGLPYYTIRMPNGREKQTERQYLEELKVGSLLSYRKSTEDAAVSVTLLNVHYDHDPPYYTIEMPDGSERQTIRENLEVKSNRENYLAATEQSKSKKFSNKMTPGKLGAEVYGRYKGGKFVGSRT